MTSFHMGEKWQAALQRRRSDIAHLADVADNLNVVDRRATEMDRRINEPSDVGDLDVCPVTDKLAHVSAVVRITGGNFRLTTVSQIIRTFTIYLRPAQEHHYLSSLAEAGLVQYLVADDT